MKSHVVQTTKVRSCTIRASVIAENPTRIVPFQWNIAWKICCKHQYGQPTCQPEELGCFHALQATPSQTLSPKTLAEVPGFVGFINFMSQAKQIVWIGLDSQSDKSMMISGIISRST